MICPACHSALTDDVRYCLHCGRYVGEETFISPRAQSPIPTGTNSKPFSSLQGDIGPRKSVITTLGLGIATVGGLILIAIIAALIYEMGRNSSPRSFAETGSNASSETRASRSQPTPMTYDAQRSASVSSIPSPTPRPTLQRTLLLSQTFGLSAGEFREFTVNLTNRSRIQGSFRASGGFGNDVYCSLYDGVRTYYDSGKTSSGAVDVLLEPGAYTLRFDNTHAKVFGKKVGATFYVLH